MLVISDTSPLIALSYVGRLELLRSLYHDVLIPPAVIRELETSPDSRIRDVVRAAEFVRVQAPSLALNSADLPRGRRAGERLGLRVVGTLGVLLSAKAAGLIDAVTPIVESLERGISFRIAPTLWAAVLQSAGE